MTPTPTTKAERRALLAALPKIELHRHLEGSLRLSTLVDVARQYALDVPSVDPDVLRPYVQIMPDSPATVEHFLSKFAMLRRFYCAPEVIGRVAREAVEDAAADNVRYMELRFTPKALTKARGFAFEDVIAWVVSGVAEAQATCPIRVRLIIALNRHESLIEGEQAFRAALDYRDQGIVGVDLCGQEDGYPARPFYGLFQEAQQAGLKVTLHAGEWAGPQNIRYAIERMGAVRIGHGVRILEDSSVVDLAREAGTVFEVCPTSNVHSGVVPTLAAHPLRAMHDLGLSVTLNTDDPGISDIVLTDELDAAMEWQDMGWHTIRQSLIAAARSSFLPAEQQDALAEEIGSAFDALLR